VHGTAPGNLLWVFITLSAALVVGAITAISPGDLIGFKIPSRPAVAAKSNASAAWISKAAKPAILPAALSEPDSPANVRPEDPDHEGAWWVYFEEEVRNFVRNRFTAPETATPEEKRIAEVRITKEMTDVVTYYEQVRTRERAVYALQLQQLELQAENPVTDPEPAPLEQSSASGADTPVLNQSTGSFGPSG